MNTTSMQGKVSRWISMVLALLVLALGAVAAMLYLQNNDLEASLSQAQANTAKMQQEATAARKKWQDDLKAANAKAAAQEQALAEANKMKTLLDKLEPQLATVLEAASRAKTSKPDARAAALVGLGLIGQIAHGESNEASLALFDRALAIDNSNCVAGLAINLSGTKNIDVTPDCAALLPIGTPAAIEVKPTAETKPAPETKPATVAKPAPSSGPAAQPAVKG